MKAFLNRQENIRTLSIDYAKMVQQPDAYFTQIIEFLDVPLNVEAMETVIDPGLYRQKE